MKRISFKKPNRKPMITAQSEARLNSDRFYDPPPLNISENKLRYSVQASRKATSSLGVYRSNRPPSKWIKNIGFGWDLLE